jgi:hypothetical protein
VTDTQFYKDVKQVLIVIEDDVEQSVVNYDLQIVPIRIEIGLSVIKSMFQLYEQADFLIDDIKRAVK